MRVTFSEPEVKAAMSGESGNGVAFFCVTRCVTRQDENGQIPDDVLKNALGQTGTGLVEFVSWVHQRREFRDLKAGASARKNGRETSRVRRSPCIVA